MSNEVEKNVEQSEVETAETKVVEVKSKKLSTVIKEVISAIVGAIIAFAVTFGVITTDQEAEIKSRMANINTSATEVVELLKKGDVVNALAKANKIVEDTNTITSIAKEGIENTKKKSEETKEIVKKTTAEIKKATSNTKKEVEK